MAAKNSGAAPSTTTAPPPTEAGGARSLGTGETLPRATAQQRALVLRLSGAILAILALGTFVAITMSGGGISRFGFAYMAGRWSNPFWQAWDLALLWLAVPHGVIGLCAASRAHATNPNDRLWARVLIVLVGATTLVVGTLVILTFDPNLTP